MYGPNASTFLGSRHIAKGEAGEAKVIWTFDMYGDKAVGSRPLSDAWPPTARLPD